MTNKKLFTLEEANATLPLVRKIAADIVHDSAILTDRRQRLEHLTTGRELQTRDPYEGELAQVKSELDRDASRLRGFYGEMRQIGATVTDAAKGLVDFPCEMDGQPACYCWRVGEAEVLYWHEPSCCPEGRQPVAATTLADNDQPWPSGAA